MANFATMTTDNPAAIAWREFTVSNVSFLDELDSDVSLSTDEKIAQLAFCWQTTPREARLLLDGIAICKKMPALFSSIIQKGIFSLNRIKSLAQKLMEATASQLKAVEEKLIEVYTPQQQDAPLPAQSLVGRRITEAAPPASPPKKPTHAADSPAPQRTTPTLDKATTTLFTELTEPHPTHEHADRSAVRVEAIEHTINENFDADGLAALISTMPGPFVYTSEGDLVFAVTTPARSAHLVTQGIVDAQVKTGHDPHQLLLALVNGTKTPRLHLQALQLPDKQAFVEGIGWKSEEEIDEHPFYMKTTTALSPKEIAEKLLPTTIPHYAPLTPRHVKILNKFIKEINAEESSNS